MHADTKLFEVRDRATCIPAIGIKLVPGHPKQTVEENWLIAHGGYGRDFLNPYYLFGHLNYLSLKYEPYSQNNSTMQDAHKYVIDKWDSLVSGQVICLEHLRGERSEPKKSDRFAVYGESGVP